MNEIVAVVQAYNRERLRRGKRVIKFSNKHTKKGAVKLIGWCKQNNLDPINYVTVIAPMFKTLFPLHSLGNKKGYMCYMQHYRIREDTYQHERMVSKSEVKLRPAQEKFKSHYLHDQSLCLAQRQFNGGFNKASSYCRNCSYWHQCQGR